MTKKKSITIFVIVGIMLILGAVFATVPTFQLGNSLYDYTGYARTIKLGLDLAGGVSAVFDVGTTRADGTEIDADSLRTSLDGVKASLEDLLTSRGYPESVVTYNTTGSPTLTVEVPDVDDPDRVFNLIGRPATLKITKADDPDTVYIYGSEHLESVGISADSETNDGTYVVSLQFNRTGTTAFATATQAAVDGSFSLDMLINDEVLMTVSVDEAITTGRAVIRRGGGVANQGYTYQEAYEMATRLQAGTFGVELNVRETNIISPVLGDAAIRDGIIAAAIGLAIIMVLLVLLYGFFGLMANIALIGYVEAVLFLCSVLPWVQLTLPGIAGIVIGIGMAVDANVVIFERIKDEYKHGLLASGNDLFMKPLRGSDGKITSQGGPISRGFRRASVAVIDANITTLIGAAVLWIFGGTSIVGFAVTLFISIIVSMLFSLGVTNLLIRSLHGFDKLADPKYYKLKKEVVTDEEL